MALIMVYDYILNIILKNTMNLLVHSSLYWLVPTGELVVPFPGSAGRHRHQMGEAPTDISHHPILSLPGPAIPGPRGSVEVRGSGG